MINMIKTIFNEFEYKTFDGVFVHDDTIILQLEQIFVKSHQKGIKEKNGNKITIARDIISLLVNQTCKNDYEGINTKTVSTLYIGSDGATLELYQEQHYQGISTDKVDTIDIYNDRITYELTINNTIINENDHHRNYTEEVNEEMKLKIKYDI